MNIHGDPETWTYQQLYRYGRVVLGQAKSTIEGKINYLKFMEREYGLNFHQNPDNIYNDFLEYVEKRRDTEGDNAENSIDNSKHALQFLFDFFGVKHKYQWIKTHKIIKEIVVYPESVAYELHNGEYAKDPAVNATYQYIFTFGDYVGPRGATEIALLKIGNINFKERRIRFWQPKVKKWRDICLEPFIITSKVDKSLWNYLYKWRPKLEDAKSKDYFFLNQYGEPFSPDKLRQRLSKYGKKYCPYFHPYLMRHFCATYRLVQSYLRTGIFDILGVNMFMQHKKLETTMNYLHIAKKIIREYEGKQKIGRIRHASKKKLLDRNFTPQKLLPQILSYIILKSRRARSLIK